MAVMQHVRLTPLVIEAEKYEVAEAGHHHAASDTSITTADAPVQPAAEAEGWKPAEGTERTLYTTLASIVTGAGFALLMAGASLVTGLRITRSNGALWGLCGFAAVALAPAAGLPPELPGMPAGDLVARQLWWLATAAATAAALWIVFTRRETWAPVAAVALAFAPHVIGAPQPSSEETTVPTLLASHFVAVSLAANAVMWSVIGLLLGRFLPDADKDEFA